MTVLVESGVDIIEVGVPFTDPIAEGPIIQKAHDRALKNNVSLKSIFEMIEKFRKNDNDTPLVLMGYLNTFIFNKALWLLVVKLPNLEPFPANNIKTLVSQGNSIIDSEFGELASGLSGFGRLSEPKKIIDHVIKTLSSDLPLG